MYRQLRMFAPLTGDRVALRNLLGDIVANTENLLLKLWSIRTTFLKFVGVLTRL